MNNNITKFTNRAENYAAARPNYPQELMIYLSKLGINNHTKVADIGSGTGIFSKQLLSLGAEVYAVEPNDEMRKFAEKDLGNYSKFNSIKGTAEKTMIDDQSIDFITAAQAFHWFNLEAFKKECNRIIKDEGKVILLWNSRTPDTQYSKDRDNLFKNFDINNYQNSGLSKSLTNNVDHFFKNYEHLIFDNDLINTEEQYIKYTMSLSYAPTPENEKYDDFINAVKLFAKKYIKDGFVITPNNTNVYIGNIAK